MLFWLDCILQFSSSHDEFHIQFHLCRWWICECMYVCTYAICGENTEVLDVECGGKYCNDWILKGLSHCQLIAESKCSMLNQQHLQKITWRTLVGFFNTVSLLSQVWYLEISHEDSLILIIIDTSILSLMSSFCVSSTHQFFICFT
jgi:hypothetical protein